jgi:hypothetical protein
MTACRLTWWGTTRRSRHSGSRSASPVSGKVGVEPYLFEAYGLIPGADFARRPVGSPASSGEEPAERFVVCVHPATSMAKPIGPQSIGAGIQESRAVASMLRRRIHNEHIDGTVHARVGIVILAGDRSSECNDSRAVGRDKDAERCLWRTLNRGAPRLGHLRQ